MGIHSPSTVFAGIGENVTAGIEKGIGDGNGAFDALNVLSAESVEELKNSWKNISSWFEENVTNPLENVFQIFSGGMTNIFESMSNMIKFHILSSINYMNVMIDSLQTTLNSTVKAVNKVIEQINSMSEETGIHLPYIKGATLERVPIPKLAKGGIVDKPTLSWIGEAGKEAVVPLENNTGWLDKLASKISIMFSEMNEDSNSNTSFTSNLIINGRQLASATIEDFNSEAIRRGYKPLLNT